MKILWGFPQRWRLNEIAFVKCGLAYGSLKSMYPEISVLKQIKRHVHVILQVKVHIH